MLGLLSAEGAGFDLSSFKVVILEGSIAEGGEANVLAGERVFGESKCSFAFFFSPVFISFQTFHFRTDRIFPFQMVVGCVCEMLKETV